MDYILIGLFVGIIALMYWLISAILRFVGISNKGKSRGKLRESFTEVNLSFFMWWPITIFMFIVFLMVINSPLSLVMVYLERTFELSSQTEVIIFVSYDVVLSLLAIIYLVKTLKD